MRIVAVSHTAVWPVRSGSSVRRLMTLNALAELGTVDLRYIGEVTGFASAAPAIRAARVDPLVALRYE